MQSARGAPILHYAEGGTHYLSHITHMHHNHFSLILLLQKQLREFAVSDGPFTSTETSLLKLKTKLTQTEPSWATAPAVNFKRYNKSYNSFSIWMVTSKAVEIMETVAFFS